MKAYEMDERRREYTRVAYYYYKAGLTQEKIAEKMKMSRQRVNRILGKCESLGIVKIEVVGYDGLYLDLERSLEEAYSLATVRVVEPSDSRHITPTLGAAAGSYLAGIITDGDIVGFSRGRSTAALVDSMPRIHKKNLTVTQLVGGWNGQDKGADVDDIVHRFAGKLHARPSKLYAPLIVNSPEIRRSIMEESYFRDAYRVVQSCTIAVVGIGNLEERILKENTTEGMEEKDFRGYLEKNAVGEICTHFFDLSGNVVIAGMEKRIIAVTLEDFLRIPTRVGIAGSPKKHRAIEGALRGGFINVLITDVETARFLLEQAD